MKKQLKLLTDEEKRKICNKYIRDENRNSGFTCKALICPLRFHVGKEAYCYKDIHNLEERIKEYWNREINVE